MNTPSPNDSLASWLDWLTHLHPLQIDMGLTRVSKVAARLQIMPASMPLVLVGGTNGKGSTVALLSEIYTRAGYKVGAYTSPHIDTFNERMRVGGQMLSDKAIVDALHTIEQSRLPETLTYFEYTTLAAMLAFRDSACDVVLLEVGLGGRLDATNIWDADCAILTSIALDHQAFLGDTRSAVATEKVAIGRAHKPLIVGDTDPPANLIDIATAERMDLLLIDQNDLPHSALVGEHQRRNAACALAAIASLADRLPVADQYVQSGLANVSVAGRFECLLADDVQLVLDVAHNPAAAETLCTALQQTFPERPVFAVFAALNDKDIVGVAKALAPVITSWYCAGLSADRATPVPVLANTIVSVDNNASISEHETVPAAWTAAMSDALSADQQDSESEFTEPVILVAGSFFTLSDLQAHWRTQSVSIKPWVQSAIKSESKLEPESKSGLKPQVPQ